MKTGADRVYSTRSPKRGWSWETLPAPIPESEIAETITADVVIIGGGISGLAAGARCSQAGLRVVIADKNDKMIAHAGQVAALDSPIMREKGVKIDKAQFARDWLAVSGSRVREDLLWLFINRSGEAFEWLMSMAEGCLNISLYQGYRGPDFAEYPGTHHIFKKQDCTKYQNFGGGMLVCEILQTELLQNGGRIDRSVRAEQLIRSDEGRVTGFLARDAAGTVRRYLGTKGVILASGDIGGDPEMLEAFCPIGLKPSKNMFYPAGTNTGDGHKMAYWAGAALEPAQWAPSLHCIAYNQLSLFFLHVNRLGKRFMNEDTWMQAKAVRCLMQPGGDYAWTVMDGKWLQEYGERFSLIGGQGMTPLNLSTQGAEWTPDCGMAERLEADIQRGNAVKADTLEELAEKMGVPAENLLAAVSRYNELAEQGDDTDFGKRSELLTTVKEAPFYALKWGPALLDVFGGVITDVNLHVLAPEGERIPGFYAVGNAAGGMYGVDYPLLLNGNSYGRALTWALQAADSIQADSKEG